MPTNPDTEVLGFFMKDMEAFLLHNSESLIHLEIYNEFHDLIADASARLKDMIASEKSARENSDDPHGYGDWREANSYE